MLTNHRSQRRAAPLPVAAEFNRSALMQTFHAAALLFMVLFLSTACVKEDDWMSDGDTLYSKTERGTIYTSAPKPTVYPTSTYSIDEIVSAARKEIPLYTDTSPDEWRLSILIRDSLNGDPTYFVIHFARGSSIDERIVIAVSPSGEILSRPNEK